MVPSPFLLETLTKLEVGIVGAHVVTGAEKPLHHEGRAHGIEEAKVLWDATFLGEGKEGKEAPVQRGSLLE